MNESIYYKKQHSAQCGIFLLNQVVFLFIRASCFSTRQCSNAIEIIIIKRRIDTAPTSVSKLFLTSFAPYEYFESGAGHRL